MLLVADGAASPLVVGYPLLIAASGLWYRVRFVWFVTALSLISYGDPGVWTSTSGGPMGCGPTSQPDSTAT